MVYPISILAVAAATTQQPPPSGTSWGGPQRLPTFFAHPFLLGGTRNLLGPKNQDLNKIFRPKASTYVSPEIFEKVFFHPTVFWKSKRLHGGKLVRSYLFASCWWGFRALTGFGASPRRCSLESLGSEIAPALGKHDPKRKSHNKKKGWISTRKHDQQNIRFFNPSIWS